MRRVSGCERKMREGGRKKRRRRRRREKGKGGGGKRGRKDERERRAKSQGTWRLLRQALMSLSAFSHRAIRVDMEAFMCCFFTT